MSVTQDRLVYDKSNQHRVRQPAAEMDYEGAASISVNRAKLLDVSYRLNSEEASAIAFLFEMPREATSPRPLDVLWKMHERGLTESKLADVLERINRKDLAAMVKKKPKPKRPRIHNTVNGVADEALSCLLESTAAMLSVINKCLQTAAAEGASEGMILSSRDRQAARSILDECAKLGHQRCIGGPRGQISRQRSSSDSSNTTASGDEQAQVENKGVHISNPKKPMLPPKNKSRYGAPLKEVYGDSKSELLPLEEEGCDTTFSLCVAPANQSPNRQSQAQQLHGTKMGITDAAHDNGQSPKKENLVHHQPHTTHSSTHDSGYYEESVRLSSGSFTEAPGKPLLPDMEAKTHNTSLTDNT